MVSAISGGPAGRVVARRCAPTTRPSATPTSASWRAASTTPSCGRARSPTTPARGRVKRRHRPRARLDPARRRSRDAARHARTTPNSIGKTFDLVSGDTPVEEAVRGAVNEERAEEVLRRVRSVPEGRVTTYGDLCPGAPRFAGTVLSGVPRRRRAVAAHRACGRLARRRASASAGCSRRRACPSAASAWTCARPGCRSCSARSSARSARRRALGVKRCSARCRTRASAPACRRCPITIRSDPAASRNAEQRHRPGRPGRVLLDRQPVDAEPRRAPARGPRPP